MSAPRLHAALVRTLTSLRRPDGGLPVSVAGESEVEPTTLLALARDDRRARRWLAARQRPDGGYDERDGHRDGPTSSALAALVLDDPAAARRALAFAIAHRGLPLPNALDPDRRTAWGWTDDARSLTEPTARVLLAVNVLTPEDTATRREAVELFRTRQCADGGWNFGNASVYDVDLRGYAQTTAMGLIALQQRGRNGSPAGARVPPQQLATRARRADRCRRRSSLSASTGSTTRFHRSTPPSERSRDGPRSSSGPLRWRGQRLRPARTRRSIR